MGLFGKDPDLDRLRRQVDRLQQQVEMLSRHLGLPVDGAPVHRTSDLPVSQVGGVMVSDKVRGLVAEGKKIEAIKVLREETGLGLRDAKNTVEDLERYR